jgi:hypothetical protein
MTEIGPVDYMIVAFPGNQFKGEIAPALADLVEAGTIRIIDLTFVTKTSDGEVMFFELNELDPDVQAAFERAGVEVNGLFNEEDLTSGPRRSHRRFATPGASSWTSSVCRTRLSRRRGTPRSRARRRKERPGC